MTRPSKSSIFAKNIFFLLRELASALRYTVPISGPLIGDIIEELQRSRVSIDRKIELAAQSLQETSRLIAELDESLKERAEKLEQLRTEIERFSKLAEVEEGKARAVIQQLEISLNRGKNRERWVSLVINLIAGIIIFILGIF